MNASQDVVRTERLEVLNSLSEAAPVHVKLHRPHELQAPHHVVDHRHEEHTLSPPRGTRCYEGAITLQTSALRPAGVLHFASCAPTF